MSTPEKMLNANLQNELRYVSHLSKQNLDRFLYLVLYFAFFFFSIQCQPFLTFKRFFWKQDFWWWNVISLNEKLCWKSSSYWRVWDHFHSFPYNPSLEVEFLEKGPEHFSGFYTFLLNNSPGRKCWGSFLSAKKKLGPVHMSLWNAGGRGPLPILICS